jgi:hypothetical protein
MTDNPPEVSQNGQPGEPEPLAVWETRYSKAKMARQQFERQWYLNIAFFFGKQWVTWQYSVMPTSLGQLVEPPPNRSRTRITVNRVRKIVRKELARLNKERVRGFVNPNTTDTIDVSSARAADKLVDYLTDVCEVPDVMKRVDFWMLLCGTAFTKDYYSNSVNVGGAMGGPVCEAVSPFHLFVPNLDEPDIERQPWVMHVVVRDPEFLAKEYDVKIDETMTLSSSTVESRLMTVMGMTDQQAKQKGVEVKEVWVKPNDQTYPDGLHLIYIKGKILQSEPFPYAHGEFPFTRRQYIESGMFYADSLINDLIPIQLEYNRTRSQIIEDKNKMAKPMLSAVEGSISPRKIRNVPGEIILHKPGTNPPQPIPLVGLPSYVIDHLTLLRTEMDELASQQTQDGKQLPPGVTAATAIAYLQEDESSLVMDTIRDKEKGWQKVIQHFLSYVGQYWDAQHMVKTVGQNQNFEAFNFSQSDLNGQTDWRVVPGSATPRSYPAQQAQIMELLRMGVVPAPMALNSLDLGDTDRLYEEMQVDVREADLENAKMAQGLQQPVGNYQEHLQHIQRHDFYRKGQEATQQDPNLDLSFNAHTFIHIIYFLLQTNPMLQLPWQPQVIQGIRTGQIPCDDSIMIQARGLLHAAASGMLAPQPAGPGGAQAAPGAQPPAQGAINAG